MYIPPSSDKVWRDILQGKAKYNFEFLALKILLGRLLLEIERNPSPATMDKCASELHNMFVRNAVLPTAKRDLQKILGS